MHYHILLTEKCNSQCKYCYEKSLNESMLKTDIGRRFKFDFSAPETSEVNIKQLKNFLDKDANPTLIFYGGEPLLEADKIMKIMDEMDIPFRMQTNGKLLNKLPIRYLKRMGKILVSIDGDKERTDFNKGKGTYDLVTGNLWKARGEGYRGEVVARMTISQDFSDVYEQVLHILKTGVFDSVHWQIDAGFYKFDYDEKKFEKFVKEYNKSISKLVDFWMSEMRRGRILRLYPFLGIVESLLRGEKTKLRCGAGHSGYAITTNGKIVACPIMAGIVDFEAGSISENPKHLFKFDTVSSCAKCSYLDLCGGRCLYWRAAKLWPKEGDELICKTVKHLIDELKKNMPEIRKLIKEGIIQQEDFYYEKYFGPEIIP